jgi:serine/threonine-protein kinase
MGVVYEGHDRLTDRRVAVKLLRAGVHPDAMRRFVVEAAAAAAIDHPSIARTVHVDVTPEGRLFHVMELIEGCTLERALTEVAFEPEEGARLIAHVAEAVAAAHARGIVHRDIKPGNVMLSVGAPGVRVLDFGVSKIMDDTVSGGGSRTRGLLGTPRYMAPEQREGGEVGPAADVYSIGMVLEEVMTGISRKGHSADGPTPTVLVGELIGILARCLAAQPEARPAAAELAGVLDDYARRHRAPPAEQIAARAIARLRAEEPIDSAKTIDSGQSV